MGYREFAFVKTDYTEHLRYTYEYLLDINYAYILKNQNCAYVSGMQRSQKYDKLYSTEEFWFSFFSSV